MNLRLIIPLLLMFQGLRAQEYNVATATIPTELKENADAVIRLDKLEINILSAKSMTSKQTRIVTVINENGNDNVDAGEYYDKSTTVKSIEALIYDANGQLLKKMKKKDFKDVSVSEGSIVSDNRMLYLDYTPIQYPYTVVLAIRLPRI
jgi:hypothetical protein